MTKLANSLFSVVVVLLLLFCSSAEDSKLVTVNRSSFILKDAKYCSSGQLEDSSFALIHIQGRCSPFRLPNSTWWRSITESIKGDTDRYRAIMEGGIRRPVVGRKNQSNANAVLKPQEDDDVPLASSKAEYIIKLGFGTPAQSLYTIVDTGSDIAWIPCNPCSDCSDQVFQSSKSPTFKYLGCASEACQTLGSDPNCGNLNCSFTQKYGDRSEVDELLSSDTLAVGSQMKKEFIFGCATALRGNIRSAPGLVGFGREPLSFISQTAMLYDSTFSYCLPSLGNSAFTGSLRLGKGALSTPGLKFTSLLSKAAYPPFYFVELSGISVGEELVSLPAGKGTFIDSGTVITQLVDPAYTAMRDSFRRQLSNLTMAAPQGLFDTCYNIPEYGAEFPVITLHFENSVDLTLPPLNSIVPGNAEGSVACLAFALGSEVSVFGNYQQQNFRIVYDVPGSRLGIAAERCDG